MKIRHDCIISAQKTTKVFHTSENYVRLHSQFWGEKGMSLNDSRNYINK